MGKPKKDIEYETAERVMHKLRTTGLESAVDALIAVCADPKAAAPAKSAAGAALLRANGLYGEKPNRTQKPASEMSPEELSEALDELKSDLAARKVVEADDDIVGLQTGLLCAAPGHDTRYENAEWHMLQLVAGLAAVVQFARQNADHRPHRNPPVNAGLQVML